MNGDVYLTRNDGELGYKSLLNKKDDRKNDEDYWIYDLINVTAWSPVRAAGTSFHNCRNFRYGRNYFAVNANCQLASCLLSSQLSYCLPR